MPADNTPRVHLAPQHQQRLARSGVSDQVVKARKYETVETKVALEKWGFSRGQCLAPALVLPLYDATGQQAGVQIRPDNPRLSSQGKPVKYESPPKSRPVIDVPPAARERVLDLRQPLVITEGVIKADAAVSKGISCVSIAGVFAWSPQDPFWSLVPLSGRQVYVAFDSDQATNPNVRAAALRLRNQFQTRGALPTVLCLPASEDGTKIGLDEFLTGHTPEDLFALSALDVDAVTEVEIEGADCDYKETPTGLVREVAKGDETMISPLTNFNARITADIEIDNGSEVRRELEITVDLNRDRQVVYVPAEEFERMNWVTTKLGGGAIVYAGVVTRDHARVAIQSVSGKIPRRKLYEHLGWVKIGEQSVFLHAGGAIGTDLHSTHRSTAGPSGSCNLIQNQHFSVIGPIGPQQNQASIPYEVGVRIPPALKNYVLPDPLTGAELKEAVQETLYLLGEVAPPHLYLPLLAATFRIAVDRVDFSVHMVGRTNAGKTVLLGLFSQFFGPELHDRNLPGSWLSTSNSLLGLMALAKNAILPIDDFVPAGSQSDIERANREADRVFRAQGNQTGRGRCTRDGTPREGRSSQCLPISTGEDVPEGHSLNARLLTLEVKAGDVLNPTKLVALTLAQKMARQGLFAKVMASFLAWLAPRYEEERQILHEQKADFRDVFRESGRLARSVDIAADLLAGLDTFTGFCLENEAISEEQFEVLWGQLHDALHTVLDEQRKTSEESDPVSQFLRLLATAFITGRANLKDRGNQQPHYRPELWGWKECHSKANGEGTAGDSKAYFVSQGEHVGWVTAEHIYLDIESSLAVVQKLAKDSSLRPLPLTKRTLGKTLEARGLLASTTKGHYTTKLPVVGIQHRVLQIEIARFVVFQGRADTESKSLDDLLEG